MMITLSSHFLLLELAFIISLGLKSIRRCKVELIYDDLSWTYSSSFFSLIFSLLFLTSSLSCFKFYFLVKLLYMDFLNIWPLDIDEEAFVCDWINKEGLWREKETRLKLENISFEKKNNVKGANSVSSYFFLCSCCYWVMWIFNSWRNYYEYMFDVSK